MPYQSKYLSGIYNPVKDWIDRVDVASGAWSESDVTALNTFTVNGYDNGWWDKMLRIDPFAGQNSLAGLVALKTGNGSDVATGVGNIGTTFSAASGFSGNGSTAYIRTGFNFLGYPSVDQNSSLMTYIRSYGSSTSQMLTGVFSTTTFSMARTSAGNLVARMYDFADNEGQIAVTGTTGFVLANRTGSSSFSLWQGTVQTTSSSPWLGANIPTGASPNIRDLPYFCNNNAGTYETFSTANLGVISIGRGLSASEVSTFRDAVNNLMTALGRNV